MRARSCFSSPGFAVEEAMGSAASGEADHLRSLRKALFYSDGRKSPVAAAGTSAFAGSRFLHSSSSSSSRLMEEMKREMANYNKAIPDDETVVREYMEEDQAMRASFEEWMKAYGRTYKDEVEKARRFKIFKSVVRFTDALNDHASKDGSSARFGLNEFSDWNPEEAARLSGVPGWRSGRYFEMVLSCSAGDLASGRHCQ